MPAAFLTINFTVYVPGVEKLTVGFCADCNCPFPKSQVHVVGAFVERSLNVTVSGEHPETLSALKSATGATGGVWAIAIVEKKKNDIDMVIRWSFSELTFKRNTFRGKLI